MLDKKEEVATQTDVSEDPAESRDRALYIPLDPPFVVNLDDNGTLRFMQINVSLMSRNKSVIEAMGANTPRLKNDLLMLFVGQDYANLQLVEGREQLRQEALKLVQDIMLEIGNIRGVEELYFTSFVVQ
jgi:flagellar FliL protein